MKTPPTVFLKAGRSEILTIGFVLSFLLLATHQAFPQSQQWQQIDGLYGGDVRGLAVDTSGYLFACTDGGVFKSIDGGKSWQELDLGTIGFNWLSSVMVLPANDVLIGSEYGIFRSTDEGESWTLHSPPNESPDVRCFVTDSAGDVFAGCYRGGIIVSRDDGATWSQFALDSVSIFDMLLSRNGIWFAAASGGIYASEDHGKSWSFSAGPANDVSGLAEDTHGIMFASSTYGLFRSSDSGNTWENANVPGQFFSVFATKNDHILVGSTSALQRSTDAGLTWQSVESPPLAAVSFVEDLNGSEFLGTLGAGIYKSDDEINWVTSDTGVTASSIGTVWVSSTGTVFAFCASGRFYSLDTGYTWTPLDTTARLANGSFASDSKGDIFAGTSNGKILKSTDRGVSWSDFEDFTPSYYIRNILISADNVIYVAAADGSVSRSSDDGTSWTRVRATQPSDYVDQMSVAPDGNVYIHTASGAMYYSSDEGASWISMNTGQIAGDVTGLVALGNSTVLLSSFSNGIYRSIDNGLSWSKSNEGLSTYAVLSLTSDNHGNVYAAAGGEVFESQNGGIFWNNISAGLSTLFAGPLAAGSDGYLYVGTQFHGMFRLYNAYEGPLLPSTLALDQNYPNPFNGETTIVFALPVADNVEVAIYNILGQHIATAHSGYLSDGWHTVLWNGKHSASGVYFCRIMTSASSAVRKMVLIK